MSKVARDATDEEMILEAKIGFVRKGKKEADILSKCCVGHKTEKQVTLFLLFAFFFFS